MIDNNHKYKKNMIDKIGIFLDIPDMLLSNYRQDG